MNKTIIQSLASTTGSGQRGINEERDEKEDESNEKA